MFDNHDNFRRCILQAINIMHKIGLPDDNMLLVNAYQIKSLVRQDIAMYLQNQFPYYGPYGMYLYY